MARQFEIANDALEFVFGHLERPGASDGIVGALRDALNTPEAALLPGTAASEVLSLVDRGAVHALEAQPTSSKSAATLGEPEANAPWSEHDHHPAADHTPPDLNESLFGITGVAANSDAPPPSAATVSNNASNRPLDSAHPDLPAASPRLVDAALPLGSASDTGKFVPSIASMPNGDGNAGALHSPLLQQGCGGIANLAEDDWIGRGVNDWTPLKLLDHDNLLEWLVMTAPTENTHAPEPVHMQPLDLGAFLDALSVPVAALDFSG